MTWAGTGPSGYFWTTNTDGSLQRVDWEQAAGDVSGVIDNLIVIGLRGVPVSEAFPSSGNVLLYDGATWAPGTVVSTGVGLHQLLSTEHTDTIPASPIDGDIIAGSGTPASWVRFPRGVHGQKLNITQAGQLEWAFKDLLIVSSGSFVTLDSTSRRIVINKTIGSVTSVFLPSAPIYGQEVLIKDGKGDANTNTITISASGTTIDGISTFVMSQNYQSMDFLYNGTEWNII